MVFSSLSFLMATLTCYLNTPSNVYPGLDFDWAHDQTYIHFETGYFDVDDLFSRGEGGMLFRVVSQQVSPQPYWYCPCLNFKNNGDIEFYYTFGIDTVSNVYFQLGFQFSYDEEIHYNEFNYDYFTRTLGESTPFVLYNYDNDDVGMLNLMIDFYVFPSNLFGGNDYATGYGNGYDDGYSNGQSVGYDNGYDVGLDVGYDDGYSVGHDVGFSEGYNNALSTHDFSFTNLFYAIGDTPILYLRRLFGFELFGMNVMSIFMSLFTFIIVIHIIKKVF